MNIPLDRLYHYINDIAQEIYGDPVIIYRFWPHGSKNLKNLTALKPYSFYDLVIKNKIICADQEPLHFDNYETTWPHDYTCDNGEFDKLLLDHGLDHWVKIKNFKGPFFNSPTPVIVLHSEKRSQEVQKYQANQYQTAYYWSHAIISLDWFRYAQYIKQKKNPDKKFLIYNRAWAGTREYRLRFADFIVKLELEKDCKMSVNPIDPEFGIRYNAYAFKNPTWKPQAILENFFPTTTAVSNYSADFDLEDYESTDIEVVLETLFDDDRLHLTEKSLRPIACAQPFILAGTHGSLEYLRSYGFKTFGHIWDESYDQIKHPEERLIKIVDLMQQIANWAPAVREQNLAMAQDIADYNKKHFFSKQFGSMVISELKQNLEQVVNSNLSPESIRDYQTQWQNFIENKKVENFINLNKSSDFPTKESAKIVSAELKKLHNRFTC